MTIQKSCRLFAPHCFIVLCICAIMYLLVWICVDRHKDGHVVEARGGDQASLKI